MIELMDALADLQEELGVEFRLRGFVKAELFTEKQAGAMYRAGFRWLLSGFEAADPRILGNIDKRATLADNTRCIEIARAAGLKVKALMSIGHAGETYETVRAVEDWLIEMAPEEFDCTIITTYPGTPYYDRASPREDIPGVWTYRARNGDALHAYELDYRVTADYYKGDPDGGYRAYVFTDALSADDLIELRDETERHVRSRLGLAWNRSRPTLRYDHSPGAMLPEWILRGAA
jgi:radical SAM superfamily enzyme YgiQ (UPF0313 family)